MPATWLESIEEGVRLPLERPWREAVAVYLKRTGMIAAWFGAATCVFFVGALFIFVLNGAGNALYPRLGSLIKFALGCVLMVWLCSYGVHRLVGSIFNSRVSEHGWKQSNSAHSPMDFKRVDSLYVDGGPPGGITDLLNLLLPKLWRECLLGDLQERYETEVLPNYVSLYGTNGVFAARRWRRHQILVSVYTLVIYQLRAAPGPFRFLLPGRDVILGDPIRLRPLQ